MALVCGPASSIRSAVALHRHARSAYVARRAYFGEFGREECDAIETPDEKVPDVLVFTRGCTAERRLTLIANFHTKEDSAKSACAATSSDGQHLSLCLAPASWLRRYHLWIIRPQPRERPYRSDGELPASKSHMR